MSNEVQQVHIVYGKPGQMTRTKIEYLDRLWQFYTGCRYMNTSVCGSGRDFECWANGKNGITHRFRKNFPHGSEPTIYPDRFLQPLSVKKPSRIGVGFLGDLGGEWIKPNEQRFGDERPEFTLKENIFYTIEHSAHSYFFLTKNPSAWPLWNPWPENAWVGATANDLEMLIDAAGMLGQTKARHKWISFEPIVDWSPPMWGDYIGGFAELLKETGIGFIVIGGFSGGKRQPPISAVKELVEIADRAGIPVWIKNNLRDSLLQNPKYNYYSLPEWAGKQFAVTGDNSLNPVNPGPNEPMRKLRQDFPKA